MDTRKTHIQTGYDAQWAKRDIAPQAQHILTLRILQQDHCKKVIDLGCGNGQFLSLCKKSGMEVEGMELSPVGCEQAKLRYGVEVKPFDLDDKNLALPYSDKEFDYAVTIGPPESIYEVQAFMREFLRIGKKCILTLPNYAYISRRLHFMYHGVHPAMTNPYGANNFITKDWIDHHVKESGARVLHQTASYGHDEISGPVWPQSPYSELFRSFEENPLQDLPQPYVQAHTFYHQQDQKMFARFFIYVLVK